MYPFPYFGHGSAYARKCLGIVIWFRAPIDPADREAIEADVPGPFAGEAAWGAHGLNVESDDMYGMLVRMDLGVFDDGEGPSALVPSEEEWAAFEAHLEAWLRALHARHPIAFVFKASQGRRSAWHEHTVAVFATEVAPLLRAATGDDRATAAWVLEAFGDLTRGR